MAPKRLSPKNFAYFRRRRVRHPHCGGELEGLFGDCVTAYRLLGVTKSGTPVFEADSPAVVDAVDETTKDEVQPRTFIGFYCTSCEELVAWQDVGVDVKRVPARCLDDEDEDEAQKPSSGKLPAPLIHPPRRRGEELRRAVKTRWKIPPKVIQSKEEPKNA